MDNKAAAFRIGWMVFIALAVLTVVEYIISVSALYSMVLLWIIALLKAAAIVYFFMHVTRLWREESH